MFKIPFNHHYRPNRYSTDRETLNYLNSSSEVSDFIPYHALLDGTLITSPKGEKVLLYDLKLDYTTLRRSTYERFFRDLFNSAGWIGLKRVNIQEEYKGRINQLVHIENDKVFPLMTLAINKQHLFKMDKDKIDYNHFYLIIDKSFSESERHILLYRNTVNNYIKEASKHVDIIYTSNINNLCYKQPSVSLPEAKTISEARSNMRDFSRNILTLVKQNILA